MIRRGEFPSALDCALDGRDFFAFVTRRDGDACRLEFCRGFFERLHRPSCRRSPAIGLQGRKSLRPARRRRGRRTREARKTRVSAGAVGDLEGDMPCIRQACSKRTMRALGKGVVAPAAVDRAKRGLEAEAAAETGRPQYRTEHLGAKPDADRAHGDRRGRAAAGASRRTAQVPRIPCTQEAPSGQTRSSPSCRELPRRPRAAPQRLRNRARCGSRQTAANRIQWACRWFP